jgi:UDP-N-acetyl-D-mannosaminuronate dehydrogenase
MSVPCTADELGRYDALVVSTAHREFRDAALYAKVRLVVDARNVVASSNGNPHVVRA